jgi:hypothetical protein
VGFRKLFRKKFNPKKCFIIQNTKDVSANWDDIEFFDRIPYTPEPKKTENPKKTEH